MKFAMWLMNRFQVDSSLEGDLAEEWSTGRSTWWLLWQTFVAIQRALWAGFWHHKLRTLAAVSVGFIAWQLLMAAFLYGIYATGHPYFPVGLFLFFLRPVIIGWIVGRLQPTQPLGTALLFIPTLFTVTLWLSRDSLDYRAILNLGSVFIVTTTVGGLLATRKNKSFRIPA